jgi:hypothetical protein
MKRNFNRAIETLLLSGLAVLNFCALCYAGPPGTPDSFGLIPSTPVGNVEVSALTVVAVAAYGYWKNR